MALTDPWAVYAAELKKKMKQTAPAAPKKVGSYDPYDALDKLAAQIAAEAAAGPDYSQIPAPRSEDVLTKIASERAAAAFQPAETWTQEQRDILDRKKKVSQDAAQAFSLALAGLFTGGKPGDEGMAYAKENFGGSYMGAIAAEMGTDLWKQVGHDFEEQDAKLVSDLGDLLAKKPEYMDEVLQSLIEQDQNEYEAGTKIADKKYDYRMKAGGIILANARASLKDRQDALGDVGEAAKPRVFQTSEGIFAIDEATGQVVWEKKTGKAKTTKVTTQVVEQPDGSKVLIDKATGEQIKVVAPPDPTGGAATSNGKPVSPSTTSNTVKRAQAAGVAALEKVTDNIWARSGNPAPTIKTVDKETGKTITIDNPAYIKANAAYQKFLDSGKPFGSAMYRVITAISPHLKALGYTKAQIKRAAYDIVSAELDPPKGYKIPKASAARVAANNVAVVTPKTGIVTSSPWKGTHVTDNLDWNHGQRTAADIMGAAGTPVGAPEDGTIVRWGSAQGGQALYFQGVSGRRYWLGHIDSMLPVGTRVLANQQIALISADHPRPHLHIDVTGGSV